MHMRMCVLSKQEPLRWNNFLRTISEVYEKRFILINFRHLYMCGVLLLGVLAKVVNS